MELQTVDFYGATCNSLPESKSQKSSDPFLPSVWWNGSMFSLTRCDQNLWQVYAMLTSK